MPIPTKTEILARVEEVRQAVRDLASIVHRDHLTLVNLLQGLRAQMEGLMAVSQEIKDLTAKIDAATNDVAGRIDHLSQGVKNGMTDAEVAAVKAGLQAEVDRLTALGKDPANPVPPGP